ncbi:histidine kinase [Bordetella genomosp. 9]|uniref:Virulence sensor protein BvgS n=1 Tax=Bordetella genomosp. 9 TaxID=1416803 RepID=A0A261R581_9BORD|nr:response regulator [Bordetella genomosp. 9]OZI20176.1 histidine kinase [Bordetella genomosp. 9]
MQLSHKNDDMPVHLGIAILSVLILAIDIVTPLGVAIWVFYMLPVVLSVFQRNRYVPLMVALLELVFIIAGTFLPLGGNVPTQNLINRSFGLVTMFTTALLCMQVITARLNAQRLMWLQQSENALAQDLLGELSVQEIGQNALRALAKVTNAQVGAMYRLHRGALSWVGGYARDRADAPDATPGRGMALEVANHGAPLVVRDLPPGYTRVTSGVGEAAPRVLVVAPITADGRAQGVVELGFLQDGGDFERELELLRTGGEVIGVALRSALYREHLKELLEETQRQSEELQTQQEELRVSNEELEEQGRALRESQTRLEQQQSDLMQSNARLEEHTQRLEQQKRELQRARATLETNARELSRASRYKSEFLANMSHELRTPLNSSLILSQMLADPKSANMAPGEIQRYARTIHASNADLLTLINDILDLSKIEAGHVDMAPETVSAAGVLEPLRQMFEPIAAGKQLDFRIDIHDSAPATYVTDAAKLQQVLKNLLANAFKFTEQGEVVLTVRGVADGRVAFAVSDTGIGIPPHQQEVIFEAFRQADGTTSRKYGGTGLGLSISRELTRLLGGELRVESEAGKGSTFTAEITSDLAAHLAATEAQAATAADAASRESGAEAGGDAPLPATAPTRTAASPADSAGAGMRAAFARFDRSQRAEAGDAAPRAPSGSGTGLAGAGERTLGPAPNIGIFRPARGDIEERRHERMVMVIEDDERFADILYELAHELGFDCVLVSHGAEAMRLARELRPSGILLDVGLPDQSGLSVLDQLKQDPATRHIPIHVVSVADHIQTALELGAVGYALKPVAREELVEAFKRVEEKLQRRASRLLVVEDDPDLRASISLLLQADDIEITTAGTVAEALEHLATRTFDCMVMDLMLPDASGYELLEQMGTGRKYAFPPVIVYTGRALTRDEEQRLRRYSRSIIIKGAKSPERLVDEVTLFLHRVEATLPPDQQKLLMQARQRDMVFEGRRVLLVEDDVRNIFALSSVLEPLGAKLLVARNGREALDALAKDAHVDIVLMDLMMPEMDGLTATREIRKRPELRDLPIIALTAKAMTDDRRNCLEAGANDYISKPIDVDKLISLCRVWMPK